MRQTLVSNTYYHGYPLLIITRGDRFGDMATCAVVQKRMIQV